MSARGVSGRRPPAATARLAQAVDRNTGGRQPRDAEPADGPSTGARTGRPGERTGVWGAASAQSRATPPPGPVESVQLTLDLGDGPVDALDGGAVSGLPEMDAAERVQAELEVLGLDTSSHVMDFYSRFLDDLGIVRSRDLLQQRRAASMLVAGVKVATQTPPIRSGRRVVFLTLDDSTGPVDLTFFEDALGPYATTVFHSWLLVARGELRRTGRRGVSLRATGCWDLATLFDTWRSGGTSAVHAVLDPPPDERRDASDLGEVGTDGVRRLLVHSSGFAMSPYADIKPAGGQAPRKLWHSSPGSSGR